MIFSLVQGNKAVYGKTELLVYLLDERSLFRGNDIGVCDSDNDNPRAGQYDQGQAPGVSYGSIAPDSCKGARIFNF